MKPLILTMQSFGSYGKKTTIDFTKPNQNLFLITGDTGSGKSTIFDAIVFALYGEASSTLTRKDGTELQSQYADSDIEPYVELIFSEDRGGRNEVYTVKRIPRHVRKLKRGSGTKEEKETVLLFMPDDIEFLGNKRATDIKLEEIIGLNKDQFMQVAMIAQGEFMNVILSSSDEKKKIFRKLFRTEKFQKIVDELKARKDVMSSQIDGIKAELRSETGRIVLPDFLEEEEYENLYCDIAKIKECIISAGPVSASDMENLLSKLEILCSLLKEKTKEAHVILSDAKNQRDQAMSELTQAKLLKNSFDKMQEAKSVLDECEARRKEISEMEKLSVKIQDSYDVKGLFRIYEKGLAEVDSLKAQVLNQEKKLPEIMKSISDAERMKEKADKDFEKKNSDYIALHERVKNAETVFAQIDNEEKIMKDLENKVIKALEQQTDAENSLRNLSEKEKIWNATIKTCRNSKEQMIIWKTQMDKLADIKAWIEEIEKLQKEAHAEEKKSTYALKEYEQARKLFLWANSEYLEKQRLFFDAQAGFIAKELLEDGKPCPVCGSVAHPNVAVLSADHEGITRELIESLAKKASKLNEIQQDKSYESGNIAQSAKLKKQQLEFEMKKLYADMSCRYACPDEQSFDIKTARELCRSEIEKADDVGILLSKAVSDLECAERKLDDAKKLRENLESALKTVEGDLIGLREQIVLRREKIAALNAQKDFDSREEAQNVLKNAGKLRLLADNACKEISLSLQDFKSKRERCSTLIESAKSSIPQKEQSVREAKDEYLKTMDDRGLSEALWNKISLNYDLKYVDKLNKDVLEYRQKKAAAEGAFETAKASIGDKSKPDIIEAESQAELAQKKMEAAEQHYDRVRRVFETDNGVYENLLPKMEKQYETAVQFTRLESMYSRLSGKVSGARMDIETFVQRYYLERILYAANRRFSIMTSGQYELKMTELDRAGEGRNRGLDLMVYSYVTDSEREIKTLSGGEKFMAALALALGMSDQIQESVSSINLDMMFIDEGFGSLSDQARSQAIRVLQDMAGGERLIGIISHVSELKQEIENQLNVRKDDAGSHISWSIS